MRKIKTPKHWYFQIKTYILFFFLNEINKMYVQMQKIHLEHNNMQFLIPGNRNILMTLV